MIIRAALAPPALACPDAEQLAAYIDGVLLAGERTDVEQHLPHCTDCRGIVAATAPPCSAAASMSARYWWIAMADGWSRLRAAARRLARITPRPLR